MYYYMRTDSQENLTGHSISISTVMTPKKTHKLAQFRTLAPANVYCGLTGGVLLITLLTAPAAEDIITVGRPAFLIASSESLNKPLY